MADTRLTFGFHVLLERLWEWLTRIPKVTPLLQISHFAICCTSLRLTFGLRFLICKQLFHISRIMRKMQA